MTGSIKIGVGAELNESDFQAVAREIERKFNAMGQTVARASKLKFEPVSIKTKKDLDDVLKGMNSLLKIQTDLARRAKSTNQGDLNPLSYDYNKLYTNQSTRIRKMQEVLQYLGGEFSGKDVKRPAWQQVGLNATQAGLRAASGATGGVGGVAAGALGTGMNAGFGAGMMGLLGGIVALGVGKAVGAVAEHIGKAEQGNIDLDRLKRTLGDVGVQFEALKASVHGSADILKITFDEAGKLASQFSKLGNLSGPGAAREIAGELSTSVGLARALGLDPSQTTGVLGQMRGVGVTRNEQDTRRFALLIGETIGRSGAFAKADEVMEAIGNYAAMQTRNSMGGANVGGYAGMLAGMIGSGIPGLDPTGAGGMLSRINAALSGGGAAGEASQFVSAIVGKQMGLSPLQTQVLMEGGAFATNNKMFGSGSAYARYMGKAGPGGDSTFYDQTRKYVEGAYSGNSDESRLLRAQAFARHTGLNMNQAMAMLSINPAQMGTLSRFGDVSGFNASGITGIATAMHGSAADRQRLSQDLLGRTGRGALSGEDAASLKKLMGTDSTELRELLARLSAKYGQEETTGSIARDTKALLDNIKTNIADKLVPYVSDMREGILYLAGNREKTGVDVLKEIAEKGSEYRRKQIGAQFDTRDMVGRRAGLQAQLDALPTEGRLRDRLRAGVITQEQYDQQMRERVRLETQLDLVNTDILSLTREKEALLKKEVERLKKEQDAIDADASARQQISTASLGAGAGAAAASPAAAASRGSGNRNFDALFAKYGKQYGVDPRLLKAIAMKESGLNPNAVSPANANGTRDYGLMQHNGRYLDSRGLTNDWSDPERSVEEAAKLLRKNIDASGGDVRRGVRMYNGRGPRAEAYADDIMRRYQSTPMPEEAVAARGGDALMSFRGSFEPALITLQYPDGRPAAPQMSLNPRFQMPVFGRPS